MNNYSLFRTLFDFFCFCLPFGELYRYQCLLSLNNHLVARREVYELVRFILVDQQLLALKNTLFFILITNISDEHIILSSERVGSARHIESYLFICIRYSLVLLGQPYWLAYFLIYSLFGRFLWVSVEIPNIFNWTRKTLKKLFYFCWCSY